MQRMQRLGFETSSQLLWLSHPSSQPELLLFWFFLKDFILYLWLHCHCLQTHQKRASYLITGGCEPPCGCWDLNSGPLEEQSLTLQPLGAHYIFLFSSHQEKRYLWCVKHTSVDNQQCNQFSHCRQSHSDKQNYLGLRMGCVARPCLCSVFTAPSRHIPKLLHLCVCMHVWLWTYKSLYSACVLRSEDSFQESILSIM